MTPSTHRPERTEGDVHAAPGPPRLVNPITILGLGGAVSMLLLTLLGVLAWGTQGAYSAQQELHSLQSTVGRVVWLNGVITNAVRMAALSGDPAWREEYRRLSPAIEGEIQRLIEGAGLVGQEEAAERIRTTHLRMAVLEQEVLVRPGPRESFGTAERPAWREYSERKAVLYDSIHRIENAVALALSGYAGSVAWRVRVSVRLLGLVLLALAATWLRIYRLFRGYLRARDRAETELAESEAQLRALVRSMDDVVMIIDGDGRYLDIAASGVPMLLPVSELPGKRLHDCFSPDLADCFLLHIRRALTTGETQYLEYSLQIEGRAVWRSAAVSPMPGDRVVWVARDITELKRAEERSNERWNYLRAVIDASPDLIFVKDYDGRFILANRALAERYGTSPEEMVGKTDAEFNRNGEEVKALLRVDREVIDTGADLSIREEPLTDSSTGEVRWYHTRKIRFEPPNEAPPQVVGIATDVTDRKQAEDALREISHRLQSHLDQTLLGVVEYDRDGIIQSWNPAAERIFGYRKEEVLGQHYRLVVPDPALREVEHIQRQVLGKQRAYHSINENATRDGQVLICEWYNTPLVDASGNVTGVAAMVRDITEQRRIEAALRDSEEKFRQLAENIREVFWIASPDLSTVHYVSPAYEEITGRSRESLDEHGHILWSAIHPEDLRRAGEVRCRIAAGEPVEVDFRIQHDDGSTRWVRVRTSPVLGERGEPFRTVGIAEDITERKRAELERVAAEAHYRRLVTTSPEPIYALDTGGSITEANPALERLLGRPQDELLGHHYSEFVVTEDVAEVEEKFQELMSGTRRDLDLEIRVERPSGELRLVTIRATAIFDAGNVTGLQGIIHDITEERARQETMRLQAAALDNLAEGVMISDADERVVYANSAAARILGLEPTGILRMRMEDFLLEESMHKQAEKILEALQRAARWRGRVQWRRPVDGEWIQLNVIADRVSGAGEGQTDYLFSIFHDAGEDIVREQYIRRAERLGSLATLVRGVAHELNNPLHAIRNFADLMLLDGRSGEDREALRYIRQEADRAAQVVADMHRFARQAEEEGDERSIVNLSEAVREALKLHLYALRSGGVTLEEQLAHDLPSVRVNRKEVEQVILNLITNAEHAMEGGVGERKLIVRTRPSTLGAAVEIIDSGRGIAPEDQERIFDPFWTTKAPGEGRGLGLAVAHSIVVEHGGEIRVESVPGGGARFIVDLPLAEELAPQE